MTVEKFGRYVVKRPLGKGGMAVVHLAYDPTMRREVAIKVLPSHLTNDPDFRSRLEREVLTVAQLEHPCIVPVYDYGEENNQPYVVMRHMSGGSLLGLIRKKPLSPSELSRIVGRIARALDKAHSNNIIHRDIKPANILFDDQDQAYLSDFGIAKIIEDSATKTGVTTIGTPAYMSPEQGSGAKHIDGRSDIYGLGIIVFEALTGQLPYQADTPVALLMQHFTKEIPSILEAKPDLPPGYEIVIRQAMAKTPDQRYATASDLAEDLAAIARGDTIRSRITSEPGATKPVVPALDQQPVTTPTRLSVPGVIQDENQAGKRKQNRRKLVTTLAVAGIGLLFAGGLTGLLLTRNSDAPSTPAPQPIAVIDTETPTPRPMMAGIVKEAAVKLYSGPGDKYTSLGILDKDTNTALIGRNAQGDWLKIKSASGEEGWIDTKKVDVLMPVLEIPVIIEPTSTARPTLSPSLTPFPSPTVTSVPSTPTPTQTATPEPTLTPTPLIVTCPNEPQGEFRALWNKYKERLKCPHQTTPIAGFFAEQPYQNGHMFWSEEAALYLITVGENNGTWRLFPEDDSTWKEGMPDKSCDIPTPNGLIHPIRGFGGLWCDYPELREQIGWAVDTEHGFEDGVDLIQRFEGGVIFRDSDGFARRLTYVMFWDDETYVREAY